MYVLDYNLVPMMQNTLLFQFFILVLYLYRYLLLG